LDDCGALVSVDGRCSLLLELAKQRVRFCRSASSDVSRASIVGRLLQLKIPDLVDKDLIWPMTRTSRLIGGRTQPLGENHVVDAQAPGGPK
jgi:hypothetical protein